MRWSNVRLIFRRELKDQLRDRRTIFMIFVFPILLYPLMGLGMAQLSASFEEKPRTVMVVGGAIARDAGAFEPQARRLRAVLVR